MQHQFRREGQLAREHAESATSLSEEHGFPLWSAWGTVIHGWALAEQAMQHARVVVTPGHDFSLQSAGDHIRFSTASDMAQLDTAAARLQAWLEAA